MMHEPPAPGWGSGAPCPKGHKADSARLACTCISIHGSPTIVSHADTGAVCVVHHVLMYVGTRPLLHETDMSTPSGACICSLPHT